MSHLVFSADLIKTPWAGFVPTLESKRYRLVGVLPTDEGAVGAELYTASGSTPMRAYENLVRRTKRLWCVALRETDLINLDQESWKRMIHRIPRLKMISDNLWKWAEPIWETAWDDPPDSLHQSEALWLALMAAHETLIQREQDVPF